jgi:hypothetical protein
LVLIVTVNTIYGHLLFLEKRLLNNFIGSIIDDENHSLLHYLVVRGDDAGIQMVLETNSTRKTTLKNKRNFTFYRYERY